MEGAFRIDSKVYRAVEKVICLVKLNLIWLAFSIPIVTMGAANCALHETASRIVEGTEGYILHTFLDTFRRKFKQATLLWIPFLIAGIGIYLDFCFWKQMPEGLGSVMMALVMVLGIVYFSFLVYAFPLATRMETGFKMTLRNAALLAFKYLPRTLYLLLWLGILWIMGKIWAVGLLFTLLAGISTVAVIHAAMLKKIFLKEGVSLA